MKKVQKSVDTRTGSLGNVEVSVFESIEEVTEFYGVDAILSELNGAVTRESLRIARANFSKEVADGDEEIDVQALVNAYRFGVRSTKPSDKSFMTLCTQAASAGLAEELTQAITLKATEDVTAAYNYLAEAISNA